MYDKKKINLFILCSLTFVFITGLLNIKIIKANTMVDFNSFNKSDPRIFFESQKQNIKVVPCGITIGVKINTNGIVVLGTQKIKTILGESNPPENLHVGDLILSANGKYLSNKEDLINEVEISDQLDLKIKRNNRVNDIKIKSVKSEDGKNKIGAWVRDSTQGIGTMTYYNPMTNKFGALGHGITDIDTQQLMSVKCGDINKANGLSVIKGERGNPGEILGDIKYGKKIGNIKLNNEFGIYGTLDLATIRSNIPDEQLSIALKNEIHEGPAYIRSNIEDGNIKNYDVYVESVNRLSIDSSKGMIIRITDRKLLNKTNGIVQGMSGSPIIQDNKLIGAVTHVFVKEPSKGYGIFIENMLKQEELI